MEQLGLWRPPAGAAVAVEEDAEVYEAHPTPVSEAGLSLSDRHGPIADDRLPIADDGQPLAEAGLSSSARRDPIADDRLPLADDGQPLAEARSSADRGEPIAGAQSMRVEVGEQGAAAATPGAVVRTLARYTGRAVRVTFTQNRSTMISYREKHGGALDIRLHQMFLEAPDGVLAALAVYLTGRDKRAAAVIDGFIRARQAEVPPPDVRCVPTGRFHDLRALFDRLNATYFHGACVARITWGSAGSRRYRRSIQLGCYVRGESLIRVHPCLDQAFVPEFYVAWIVFHEMLHEVFGVERHGTRHSIHPPEFVAIEQTYPDYARCKAWEEQNLPRLLRFRPVANRFGGR